MSTTRGNREDNLHSAIWGPCNPHTSHGRVNDVAEQIVVRKAMRKHPVECVAVRQAVLVFTGVIRTWDPSENESFDLPRIFDEVNEILFNLHDEQPITRRL